MKIRHDVSEEFYKKGFNNETDPFNRKDLAERLTKLYCTLSQSTVSVLHGRWGSGKTVFARQWQSHLHENGIPSIYFDAFAADYVENPFHALAAAFVRACSEARAYDQDAYDRFIDAVAKAGKAVAAPAAKLLFKAVTLGMIGSAEFGDLKNVAEGISSDFGDISEASVKAMLEDQAGNEASFKALRKSIQDLPELLSQKLRHETPDSVRQTDAQTSLVVIIDELDRCRPDFALGIMEVLKHFFLADRVHFILVTNLDHLNLSVQKRYGVGEAASEYIQKFYDFFIPFEGQAELGRDSVGALHARRLLQNMLNGSNTNDGNYLIKFVVDIINAFDLSLRQSEKIVANIVLAQIDFTNDTYRPAILIAFLSAIKTLDPKLFSEIKREKHEYQKIEKFVRSGNWDEGEFSDRMRSVLRYHSDPTIDPNDAEYRNYGTSLWRFHDRLDILPYVANHIIDRFG